MQYSTKRIDQALEREQIEAEITFYQSLADENSQWLLESIQAGKYEQLVRHCLHLYHNYSNKADRLLAIASEPFVVKQCYYLAALAAKQSFQLVQAGFPHQLRDGAGPYNFKRNNFNFSKAAILANDRTLTLSITGEHTTEGLLVKGEYEKVQSILPKSWEAIRNEIDQCFWAIAYGEQTVFDDALAARIKMLRRQSSHGATVLDSWGLALIKLAQQRGMTCTLNVIELPWQRLDDIPVDKTGVIFPLEAELQAIIQQKGRRG